MSLKSEGDRFVYRDGKGLVWNRSKGTGQTLDSLMDQNCAAEDPNIALERLQRRVLARMLVPEGGLERASPSVFSSIPSKSRAIEVFASVMNEATERKPVLHRFWHFLRRSPSVSRMVGWRIARIRRR